VRPDELRRGHRLELAAPAMENEVDVRERLEPRAEARHRLAHAFATAPTRPCASV
jgi:hypothetical protein